MKTSRERQTKNAHYKIRTSEKYPLMRYKPYLNYVIRADENQIVPPLSSSKLGLEFCIFILYTDGKLYIKREWKYHLGHIVILAFLSKHMKG